MKWLHVDVSSHRLKVRRVNKRAQSGRPGHQGTQSGGDREACRTARIRQRSTQPAVQLNEQPVAKMKSQITVKPNTKLELDEKSGDE